MFALDLGQKTQRPKAKRPSSNVDGQESHGIPECHPHRRGPSFSSRLLLATALTQGRHRQASEKPHRFRVLLATRKSYGTCQAVIGSVVQTADKQTLPLCPFVLRPDEGDVQGPGILCTWSLGVHIRTLGRCWLSVTQRTQGRM